MAGWGGPPTFRVTFRLVGPPPHPVPRIKKEYSTPPPTPLGFTADHPKDVPSLGREPGG